MERLTEGLPEFGLLNLAHPGEGVWGKEGVLALRFGLRLGSPATDHPFGLRACFIAWSVRAPRRGRWPMARIGAAKRGRGTAGPSGPGPMPGPAMPGSIPAPGPRGTPTLAGGRGDGGGPLPVVPSALPTRPRRSG